jgi:hypothetical protein
MYRKVQFSVILSLITTRATEMHVAVFSIHVEVIKLTLTLLFAGTILRIVVGEVLGAVNFAVVGHSQKTIGLMK